MSGILKKRKSSVQSELVFLTLLFVIIGTVAIIAANTGFMSAFSLHRQKQLSREAFEAARTAALDSDSFYSDMAEIKAKYNSDISIYDVSGRLAYSSAMSDFTPGWLAGPGADFFSGLRKKEFAVEKRTVEKDGSVFEVRKDLGTDISYLVYSSTISSGSTIEISSQLDFYSSTANSTTRYVSFVACFTFALILLVVYLCLHHLTAPLVEMNEITKDMARMNFERKLPDLGTNEIGQLAESINTLSESLDETLRDLNEKNKQLESDIEHERRLEQIRRQFVSNASHELKTPIAIIQGYAEGIKSGMDPVEYSGVIVDETVKMNRLVCDMLELSHYESGSIPLDVTEFSVAELVNDTLSSYRMLAEERGITLMFDGQADVLVRGDADKLATCLGNYVSNALSHASGEKIVRVTSSVSGGRASVTVFNTGSHVSDEDAPNIWNSFYRADKAHSREEGRFGLGLSIVRAIIEAHGTDCRFRNVDGGVEFTFEIETADK